MTMPSPSKLRPEDFPVERASEGFMGRVDGGARSWHLTFPVLGHAVD